MTLYQRWPHLFVCAAVLAACTQEEPARRTAKSATKSEDSGECYSLVKKSEKKSFLLTLLDDGHLAAGDVLVGRTSDALDNDSGFNLSLANIENFFGYGKPWPGGVIPYAFFTGSSTAFMNGVKSNLTALQTALQPTITFVERTDQTNYIVFRSVTGSLSTSFVGMISGAQEVRLATAYTQPVFFHEMLHALGMFHEQQRWDRDQYLTVNLNNIPTNLQSQVALTLGDTVGSFDFASIMLYDSCGGYTPAGCPSPWYVRKENGTQIRAPQTISTQDKETVKYLYKPMTNVDALTLLPPAYQMVSASQRLFPIFAMPTDTTLTMASYSFSNGNWSVLGRQDIPSFYFGGSGHVPVPGNYYGDVADEQAVFFAAKNKWIAGDQTYEWPMEALTGPLVPVPFRYMGGEYLDLAVFSRNDGKWYIKGMADPVAWADDKATDIPVPGNYGSTRGNVAWFNPSTGVFGFFANKEKVRVAEVENNPIPVVGDYDGDGKDDPAVYYYTNGKFTYLSSKSGKLLSGQTDTPSSMPFARDFDRDNKIELRLFDTGQNGTDYDVLANATTESTLTPVDPDQEDPDETEGQDGDGENADDEDDQLLADSDDSSSKKKKNDDSVITKHKCSSSPSDDDGD